MPLVFGDNPLPVTVQERTVNLEGQKGTENVWHYCSEDRPVN